MRGDEIGDATAVAKRLAGDGRIVDQFLAQQRPEQLIVAQLRDKLLAIGELGDLAAAVHEHNGIEALVDISSSRSPASRLSVTSVPVALRPTRMMSPSLIFCRRDVNGPSATLIEKNSSSSS